MKTVPANLLTEIRASVTTLATCVEIRRQDGQTYRVTNHDTDLDIDGNTYRHDVPFNMSAISSGSNLASDNTELTLFMDGEVFTESDFNNGLFTTAAVTVYLVNFEDTTDGRIILRNGWFGPIETNKYGVAKITIYGLLKVLDFEIGRLYQPSCDADFGDHRCKVAVRLNQTYSPLEPYRVGTWVYHFDPSAATAFTVTNPSFEADGTVSPGGPITGWTASSGALFEVVASLDGISLTPYDGTRFLTGGGAAADTERFVYQDFDLDAQGVNTAEIDAGEISIAFFAKLAQTLYLLDPVRIRLEVMDEDGNVIDALDDGYRAFDDFDEWRDRSLAGPLLSGARHLRFYIYFIKKHGEEFNAAADLVEAYWWNHTEGNPYNDVIHKLARIVEFDDRIVALPDNYAFEDATVTNSNTTAILGWTRGSSADWWRVIATSFLGQAPPDGQRNLVGGDDSSGTQKTYEISQTKHLVTDFSLDATALDLGRYAGKLTFSAVWYDDVSSSSVVLDFLEEDDTPLDSITVLDFETRGSPPVVEAIERDFVVPATARKVKITLYARSAADDSDANVGFDLFKFYFLNSERPKKDDLVVATGEDVTFSTDAGSYTIDGKLVWKAHTAHVEYDDVAAVTDRKTFNGTNIAGGENAFVTSVIRWISGSNTGQRNLIRLWDGDTKAIKLYFPCTNDIQVGDKFQYIRPCHKRFLEDCVLTYDNALNFRGFPHLPGKLKD